MNILSLVSQQIDVTGQSNWPDHIRLDSIRQNLYSIRFDSTYFLKNHIRFDSIRLSRIESNRIIRQFDSFSVSGRSRHQYLRFLGYVTLLYVYIDYISVPLQIFIIYSTHTSQKKYFFS